MTIQYTILFTVDLLHEYFGNGQLTDVEMVPSVDTAALLKGMNIIWRRSGSRYFALVKANPKSGTVFTPAVNTPPEKRFRELFEKNVLRFYLTSKNPLFFNYSNLVEVNNEHRYYFSNTAGNTKPGALFLSKPIPVVANGKEYVPGDLVTAPATGTAFEAIAKHTSTGEAQLSDATKWQQKGLAFLSKKLPVFTLGKAYRAGEWVFGRNSEGVETDDVFEAVKDTVAVTITQLADAALWSSRGKGNLSYPGPADQILISTGHFLFTLPAAVRRASTHFFAFNYNAADPQFDVPVGEPVIQTFTEPQATVPVDFSKLPPGRYKIKVNEETETVYYDPALGQAAVLGMTEIFLHLPGTDDYAFLNNDEEIRPVAYTLHFPARRVLWKYRRKDGRAIEVKDNSEPVRYEFALQGNDFVSTKPIQMSQEAVDSLSLNFTNGDAKLFPLPNPPVSRLGRFRQNGYDYFSTELILNY